MNSNPSTVIEQQRLMIAAKEHRIQLLHAEIASLKATHQLELTQLRKTLRATDASSSEPALDLLSRTISAVKILLLAKAYDTIPQLLSFSRMKGQGAGLRALAILNDFAQCVRWGFWLGCDPGTAWSKDLLHKMMYELAGVSGEYHRFFMARIEAGNGGADDV